ncbi:MAG: thiamine diphosphokinase [Oscillospiraceae bacterium]|jgi:thiamine pyrophosphokinase|nr:thiamine diphosphokinase [Oscillospiraceae bacterium]
MRTCFIAGAGDWDSRTLPRAGDFVIAADGGYAHLREMGAEPDVLLGDFDSLGEVPTFEDGTRVERFPTEKDDTDMMLAVKHALAQGFRRFVLNGGMGGRLDHTLANLQALAHIAVRGGRGFLAGEQSATVICDGEVRFSAIAGGYVSVFAYGGEASGVTIEGMKYCVRDVTLTTDEPRGTSNEFTGAPARVAVRRGMLLVVWSGGIFDTVEDFL